MRKFCVTILKKVVMDSVDGRMDTNCIVPSERILVVFLLNLMLFSTQNASLIRLTSAPKSKIALPCCLLSSAPNIGKETVCP